MSEALLSVFFSLTAFFYAIVGFGGGSTYNALLMLGDFDFRLIPIIALVCNLIVVSGGLFHFGKAGHLKPEVILPFLVTSIPAAYLGGTLPVSERWFIIILGVSLLISGLVLLQPTYKRKVMELSSGWRWGFGLPMGLLLGLLAGITGIGGGVFLAPIMYLSGWATPKIIAASASLFIFVNSIAALSGQLSRFAQFQSGAEFLPYAMLPLAVLIGGQLGSYFGSGVVGERAIRIMTGLLIFIVGSRVLFQAAG